MGNWCRYDAARGVLTLELHVQPNARKSGFAGLHGEALKVRIAAPAVDDKANTALCGFIAESLDVARSAVRVIRGERSREKVLEITGADGASVSRTAGWIA